MKLSVLVVNINNLEYTKNCILDLENQDSQDFDLTVVDQGSTELGTEEFLLYLESKNIKVIRNGHNKPLNWIWNEFYRNSNTDYLCYLNNDVSLSPNFISDTIKILDKESEVGIVIHTTNSSRYNKISDTLQYVYLDWRIKQGWDFTVRKSAYVEIPQILKFYWGDDWIFHQAYEKGFNVAICLSSPIIHYGEKSSGYSPVSYIEERDNYFILGLKQYLPHYNPYSEVVPTFLEFESEHFTVFIYTGESDVSEFDTFNLDEVNKMNELILQQISGDFNLIKKFLKDEISKTNWFYGMQIKILCSVEISKALFSGKKYLVLKTNKFSEVYSEFIPGAFVIDSIEELRNILIKYN